MKTQKEPSLRQFKRHLRTQFHQPALPTLEAYDAIEACAEKAEETCPDFKERAREFVLGYLRDHGPTVGEKITLACTSAGIKPHDDRAFGAVYTGLSRAKLIELAGYAIRERGHGGGINRIWQLAVAPPLES